jgi:acyl transferase domain-containing protein/NAD(P)-dependent dehydrogenase (short-subunit alcohol dehydrogenase family)/acyl carrier protein
MVMALRHETLPRTLHVDRPSQQVNWSAGEVSLLVEEQPWPRREQPRRAGVSSFGASGTNAHVIVEEAPPEGIRRGGAPGQGASSDERDVGDSHEAREEEHDANSAAQVGLLDAGAVPLLLSARNEAALRGQAARLHARSSGDPHLRMEDIGLSLTGRSKLDHRAVAVGEERKELLAGLEAIAAGDTAADVVSGAVRPTGPGGVVFVFPGQGSQWVGMALELRDRSKVFSERLHECEEALSPFIDWSLRDVLSGVDGAPGLERIDVVQPTLFAVMVALAGLWRACGVQPAAVVGHSQGEIAAAYVAGAFSLDEAARMVALRSQMLLTKMAGRGGVVSLGLGVEQARDLLARWEGRLVVSGVNGPRSVAVAGDNEALGELLRECSASEIRAREVPATVATHSSHVEEFHDEALATFSTLLPRSGEIAFYSTVTAGLIDTAELNAEYWYRNLREPVEFEGVTRALLADGYRTFIEVSPHPVLAVGMHETLEDALARGSEWTKESAPKEAAREIAPTALSVADVGVHGSLRRGEGGPQRFLTSLSEVWVRGVEVDWDALFEGIDADAVQLPTYAFQRRRYWLDAAAGGTGDLASVGQLSTRHPLVGAAVALAESDGWLFTGRISLQQHPWFADHGVGDSVVVPGTTFVEIALRAGDLLECDELQDLVFERPLILPERGAVQLQVTVGAPDETDRRAISVFSRLENASGGAPATDAERVWTRHAHGLLARSPNEAVALERDSRALAAESWPPMGARPIAVDELYDYFAGVGLDYGPAFLSIRAAWRRGEEAFTEVRLPEGLRTEAAQCGIHPALLDCALQTGGVLMREENPATPEHAVFPFAWSQVRLHARGTTSLRVRLAQLPQGGMSMLASDEQGRAVLAAGSVVVRKVSAEFLRSFGGSQRHSLFQLEWSEVAGTASGVECAPPPPETVVARVGGERLEDGAEALPAATRRILAQGLSLTQEWLAEEHPADARLVFVTRGAVSVGPQEGVGDPAAASLWGLVRSAQSEHPGSFVLVDLDCAELSAEALQAVLASEEPQVALRAGKLLAARLRRVEPELGDAGRDPAGIGVCASGEPGTVLITGGTGALGSLLARHLVEDRTVRSLLLASREGPLAPRAERLRAELRELGAHVTIAECDVSDREQLARLIDAVEPEYPLSAVIHTAGALDDGVIASMTPERLDRVLAPKADAAWHLHELTKDLDLSAFILFSSSTGTLGGPAQSNYAAANAALDSLAAHRRGLGLPAISMAWGWWADSEGMASELSAADHKRMERMGMLALSPEEGLALFDAAYAIDRPAIVPARLDMAVLRVQARAGIVPPLLRDLVRTPAREGASGTGSLARRLASTPEDEREQVVLDLVRSEVASVLGHDSSDAIDIQRAFNELGFDSLTAVELRNRLSGASGVQLPATLAFDYPSTAALSDFLLRQISPEIGEREEERGPSEADVRNAIASIPLARLREAGMVDALLRLAGLAEESEAPLEQERLETIDEMDVESLVKMTLADDDVIDELEVGS